MNKVSESPACRVLIVEDEALVALLIEDALTELGCEIVGPTGKLEAALKLVEEAEFDAAVLDVEIRGGKVYAVAEQLMTQGIPFIFASGYADWALPETLRERPRLLKPFTKAALDEQLRELRDAVAVLKRSAG